MTNKHQCSLIAFVVVDFYPSISIELLNAALEFARKYDQITDEERNYTACQKIMLTQLWRMLGQEVIM